MGKRRKARIIALQGLYVIEAGQASVDEVLRFKWEKKKLPAEILNFASELVRGSYENRENIDNLIKYTAKDWSIDKLSIIDKNILRFSIFCLNSKKDIPPEIVINEAVELAKIFGEKKSPSFINGVLDAVLKNKKYSDSDTEKEKRVKALKKVNNPPDGKPKKTRITIKKRD